MLKLSSILYRIFIQVSYLDCLPIIFSIASHTSPGAVKTCIYEGVRNNSLSQTPLPDINELLNANIVLTTYDVLKEDLSHDSDRHEGDRRALRFEKRYPSACNFLLLFYEFAWLESCLKVEVLLLLIFVSS